MVSQTVRPPAPLDPGALAQSLAPFGESRMLPSAAYVDPGQHPALAERREGLREGARVQRSGRERCLTDHTVKPKRRAGGVSR